MLSPLKLEPRTDAGHPASIPRVDYGGTGHDLHFLHANGYPPGCYRPLLDRLTASHHVFGMPLRPLWPGTDPQSIEDWKPFSEDLRSMLHQTGQRGVIGLGHSIGAMVTLRAALHEPEMFGALILIDPVLLPPSTILQMRILRTLRLRRGGSRLVQTALKRRRHFDDLEQLFAGYRRREIFRFIADQDLRTLVEGLTRPGANGGYDLVYSPEWEARIYQTGIWNDADLWNGIPRLQMPVLFLRGALTDTFFARTAELARKRNPAFQVITIPEATHLLPLERPHETFMAIHTFLRAHGLVEAQRN